MRLPAVVAWSIVLCCSIYACSDDPPSSSSGTGGDAGSAGDETIGGTSSTAGTSAGGKSNSAGTSGGGKTGSAGSAVVGGEGGTPEGGGHEPGDAGEAGMGGAPPFEAHAHIDLLEIDSAAGGAGAGGAGADVTGTVDFDQVGAHVVMTMRLETCPAPLGAHAMHFHDNNVCGADGAAAGPHWGGTGGPGEGGSVEPLGTIACFNAGAEYVYSPPDGTWTIGGDAATNILNHVMVLHAVGSTDKIACGLPELVP